MCVVEPLYVDYSGPCLYVPTTSSQSLAQSTLDSSLAHIKNAPLNFLFRLYVSCGGGVSRCASMIGIRERTEDVIVCFANS